MKIRYAADSAKRGKTMIARLCGAVATAILIAASASATTFVVPTRFCAPEEFDFRGKFEELLDSTYDRDFHRFRTVNGSGKYDFPPKVETSADGVLSWEIAFSEFAGIQAQDASPPTIRKWVPFFTAEQNPSTEYRLFYAEVERSSWNDYAQEFRTRERQWLLHFYDGCTLKLIQETDIPYWIGPIDEPQRE